MEFVSRLTQTIEGAQVVPGQLMKPYGPDAHLGNSHGRPLAETETVIPCREGCGAMFVVDHRNAEGHHYRLHHAPVTLRTSGPLGTVYDTATARCLATDGRLVSLYRREPDRTAPQYFSATMQDGGRDGAIKILADAEARALFNALPEKQVTAETAFATV